MKPGRGKQKGSAFERHVCKLLSLWVTNGKYADSFWRSAMSGGRATVAFNKGSTVRQIGDICSVSSEGHPLLEKYMIECKHYRDLNLDAFIISNRGTLAKFWKEACIQAKRYKREPVLIAKSNHVPILVLTRKNWSINRFPVAYLPKPVNCAIGLFENTLKLEYQHGA